jgi:hypothetical protein
MRRLDPNPNGADRHRRVHLVLSGKILLAPLHAVKLHTFMVYVQWLISAAALAGA